MAAPVWEKIPPPCTPLPRHIAIIMDGNGRWAKARGLMRVFGHEAGVNSVRTVVRYAGQVGIQSLTLYAFSTENWQRPAHEVRFLMRMLRKFLLRELEELHLNGVRLQTCGRTERLPDYVQEPLHQACTVTRNNAGLRLNLALNYGAKDELVDAARQLCAETETDIDRYSLSSQLYGAGSAPVDLLIRTAGERRLSNFLLWQSCEAFFYVTPACWPDFDRAAFEAALVFYAGLSSAPVEN